MLSWLDRLPMNLLIIWTILMALAPFAPMPHLIEKIIMLKEGTLRRPIDIFDLFFHAAPALLLALKLVRNYTR
jgi:hypothetical protein